MSKSPQVRLRKATQEDVGFIFNSWLKSYRYSAWARSVTSTIYFAEQHKLIERILKENETIIACNNDDPTQIYGFINACHVQNIFCLNYIYVKQDFRNLGVGRTLLSAFEHDAKVASIYTHHTRMAERLSAKYNMVYHPYILINTDLKETEDGEQ